MTKMLQNIDAVIFDMDGTLVDSMWVWVAVDEDYLKKYHLTEPENFHEDMEGMSYTEVAQYYIKAFPELNQTLEEIMDEWMEMAHSKYMNDVPLKPGVREFLESLKRQGKKVGIATSNTRGLVEDTLNALGIRHFFDSIKTSCEAGAGKPAPDVYRMVSGEIGVPPERCLVFEDVPMGILAGKNAGMKVCAVEDSYSVPLMEKKRALADYYIKDYHEIEKGTYEVL